MVVAPFSGGRLLRPLLRPCLMLYPHLFGRIYFYVYAGSAKKEFYFSVLLPKIDRFQSFFFKIARIEQTYENWELLYFNIPRTEKYSIAMWQWTHVFVIIQFCVWTRLATACLATTVLWHIVRLCPPWWALATAWSNQLTNTYQCILIVIVIIILSLSSQGQCWPTAG